MFNTRTTKVVKIFFKYYKYIFKMQNSVFLKI